MLHLPQRGMEWYASVLLQDVSCDMIALEILLVNSVGRVVFVFASYHMMRVVVVHKPPPPSQFAVS